MFSRKKKSGGKIGKERERGERKRRKRGERKERSMEWESSQVGKRKVEEKKGKEGVGK